MKPKFYAVLMMALENGLRSALWNELPEEGICDANIDLVVDRFHNRLMLELEQYFAFEVENV